MRWRDKPAATKEKSEAGVGVVRPFELNGVVAELFGLPGANVPDFAIVIVVPALARDGISDSFTKFVG